MIKICKVCFTFSISVSGYLCLLFSGSVCLSLRLHFVSLSLPLYNFVCLSVCVLSLYLYLFTILSMSVSYTHTLLPHRRQIECLLLLSLQTILTPQVPFYTKLGQECVAAGCSVDLFLFPNSYCDVASMSDVVRLTSGNMYKYSYFQV